MHSSCMSFAAIVTENAPCGAAGAAGAAGNASRARTSASERFICGYASIPPHEQRSRLFFLVLPSHAGGGRERLSRIEAERNPKDRQPETGGFLFVGRDSRLRGNDGRAGTADERESRMSGNEASIEATEMTHYRTDDVRIE